MGEKSFMILLCCVYYFVKTPFLLFPTIHPYTHIYINTNYLHTLNTDGYNIVTNLLGIVRAMYDKKKHTQSCVCLAMESHIYRKLLLSSFYIAYKHKYISWWYWCNHSKNCIHNLYTKSSVCVRMYIFYMRRLQFLCSIESWNGLESAEQKARNVWTERIRFHSNKLQWLAVNKFNRPRAE